MRKNITITSLVIMILSMLFVANDAQAQRRYKHLKHMKTEEGFAVTPKKTKHAAKQTVEETKTITEELLTAEPQPVEAEVINETAEASIAKTDKTKALVKEIKKIKVKDLFKEEKLAETASSLVYSNKALAKSGLGKMLAPDNVNELEPGMLFIIIGSIMAGIALTFWIVGSVVFLGTSGYNFPLYIAFIVLGVLLWFGGLAMIAVGIVKLIRSRRGR